MALLLLKLMMWMAWFSGSGMGSGVEIPLSRPDAITALQGRKLNFDPGVVKSVRGDVNSMNTTIVLEDDTHFRPFFNLKK